MPDLAPIRAFLEDEHESVRLEAARSLVAMGDLGASPMLVAGLEFGRWAARMRRRGRGV